MVKVLMEKLHSLCEQPLGDQFTLNEAMEKLERAYSEYSPGSQFIDDQLENSRDKPVICITGKYLDEKTKEALDALARANTKSPQIFSRNGRLVRVKTNEDGSCSIEELKQDSLRGELARCACFVRQAVFSVRPYGIQKRHELRDTPG